MGFLHSVLPHTAPGVVDDVEITVLSESSIRVSWEPPLTPNGIITGYQVVVTDLVSLNLSHYLTLPHEQQLDISTGICGRRL